MGGERIVGVAALQFSCTDDVTTNVNKAEKCGLALYPNFANENLLLPPRENLFLSRICYKTLLLLRCLLCYISLVSLCLPLSPSLSNVTQRHASTFYLSLLSNTVQNVVSTSFLSLCIKTLLKPRHLVFSLFNNLLITANSLIWHLQTLSQTTYKGVCPRRQKVKTAARNWV